MIFLAGSVLRRARRTACIGPVPSSPRHRTSVLVSLKRNSPRRSCLARTVGVDAAARVAFGCDVLEFHKLDSNRCVLHCNRCQAWPYAFHVPLAHEPLNPPVTSIPLRFPLPRPAKAPAAWGLDQCFCGRLYTLHALSPPPHPTNPRLNGHRALQVSAGPLAHPGFLLGLVASNSRTDRMRSLERVLRGEISAERAGSPSRCPARKSGRPQVHCSNGKTVPCPETPQTRPSPRANLLQARTPGPWLVQLLLPCSFHSSGTVLAS